jgi:hypothetical protein
MNTSGQGSPSARSVSVQTRSAMSAPASPSATIRRINAHGLIGHRESERRIARGKPGDTQDAHRVFTESVGHVAQLACRQIPLTTVGIDEVSRGVLRHGIDGEIAALQILFELHVRRKLGDEAAIAGATLRSRRASACSSLV